MAKNEKKGEEKMENKATPVAAEVVDAVPSQALVSVAKPTVLDKLTKLGIKIPRAEDMDALVTAVDLKRGALTALIDSAELPEATRAKVRTLVDLANPCKPGMEEVSTTWAPPRILVHQPTSNDPKKPESSRPGNMYSTAGQLLETPFPFIPLYFHEENINFTQGQKSPVCQSPDGKLGSQYGVCLECPHLPFGKQHNGRGDQNKTECNSQIVVLMLSTDLSQIYVCQFGKTSRSAGSALMSLAKAHPYPWKQIYLLTTEKKTGDLGTYWVLKIEPTGKDNPADVALVAKTLQELFGAERKRTLCEHYLRMMAAPLRTAEAEAAVSPGALTAGLDEEADLSPPGEATTSSVRSANKPM